MFRYVYPFAAIVGQERLKLALLLNTVNPAVGGVLIRGEKGMAKSTAVRALAEILPAIEVVVDGHRGDIIILKAAKTLAAFAGRTAVTKDDIDAAAELALPHRVRRQPLRDIVVDVRSRRQQVQGTA